MKVTVPISDHVTLSYEHSRFKRTDGPNNDYLVPSLMVVVHNTDNIPHDVEVELCERSSAHHILRRDTLHLLAIPAQSDQTSEYYFLDYWSKKEPSRWWIDDVKLDGVALDLPRVQVPDGMPPHPFLVPVHDAVVAFRGAADAFSGVMGAMRTAVCRRLNARDDQPKP